MPEIESHLVPVFGVHRLKTTLPVAQYGCCSSTSAGQLCPATVSTWNAAPRVRNGQFFPRVREALFKFLYKVCRRQQP